MLNPELRYKIRMTMDVQKFPKKEFIWYVAYQWPGFGPYVVGLDDIYLADALCKEFKSQGRQAVMTTEYPFELEIYK